MEKRTILYADDNNYMRSMFESLAPIFFEEYNLESFENGGDLIERIDRNTSDLALIVTDNEMPVLTGSEIIKNYAPRINVPFVLWYGGEKKIGEEALVNGARKYFIKCSNEKTPIDIMKELKELAHK